MMLKAIMNFFFPSPERARDEKGRLKGDDKKTPTINEAWVGGKSPAKKKTKPKRIVTGKAKLTPPKKRGRPKKQSAA